MLMKPAHYVLNWQDLEEMASDMEMWVAGTSGGLTALHMTSSLPGVPLHIVETALSRARDAQLDSLSSLRTNYSKVGHLLILRKGWHKLFSLMYMIAREKHTRYTCAVRLRQR